MTLTEEKSGEILILGPIGKIDSVNSKVLLEKITEIIDGGTRFLLLDFAGVTYINSTGLRALMLATKRLGGSGGKLILAAVNDQILRVFKISGLTSFLAVRSTKAEALASFQ
jgi:anti-sigma B factor antagonist